MFDDFISQLEVKYGLLPGELSAVWGQESNNSTDPALLGKIPTRHGRAKGPFQIMEKFWGPLPPTFEGQAERAAQILRQGGETPEARARAYYGTGTPPAGSPSPDEYVAQVMARRLGAPSQVARQPAPAGAPVPAPSGGPPMQDGMTMQDIMMALQGPQEEEQKGFWDTLTGNPMWHTGLATLAAPGFNGNWMRAVGSGMMAGMDNYEKMRMLSEEKGIRNQQLRLNTAQTAQKMIMEARRQAYMQKMAEQYPEYAAAINAGFGQEIMQGLLAPKPPEVRNFDEGTETVSKQWDPRTGSWVEVSRGPRWSPNAGFAITGYDEQGRPLMQMGGQPQMSKPTATKIEEQQLNAQERLAGLKQIESGFKPEYQTFDTQLGAEWQAFREKIGKGNRAELKKYEPYWQWRQGAISSMNEEIKRLTGAAMSEAEAKRLRSGMPDPGDGVGQGDGPTQFKSKLDESMRMTRLAILRARLAKQYGLNWQDIPLDQVDDKLLGKYLSDRAAEFVAKGLEPDEAERQAADAIRQEFGL
jgi:hypothetical protein